MKALIVDDHKINRTLLRALIKDHFSEIQLVDEAESVSGSFQLLETKNYDIVFLDIELQDGLGFEIFQKLKGPVYVVVISEHKDYAMDAFKYTVADYILRPIGISDFKRAVEKFHAFHEKAESLQKMNLDGPQTKIEKRSENDLLVNVENRYQVLSKKDVLYIKAQGKQSLIYLTNNMFYTVSKNLKEFESIMPDMFVRIHHSYLLNTKHMAYYLREKSLVKLTSGEEIPVSVRKKENFLKKFSIF